MYSKEEECKTVGFVHYSKAKLDARAYEMALVLGIFIGKGLPRMHRSQT
jgi:hypothetical protein